MSTPQPQKPSLGRVVLFRSHLSNGNSEHPAIVTRVWSDNCVNLTVFPDNGPPALYTSVVQDEDTAKAHAGQQAWRWPPRV